MAKNTGRGSRAAVPDLGRWTEGGGDFTYDEPAMWTRRETTTGRFQTAKSHGGDFGWRIGESRWRRFWRRFWR